MVLTALHVYLDIIYFHHLATSLALSKLIIVVQQTVLYALLLAISVQEVLQYVFPVSMGHFY